MTRIDAFAHYLPESIYEALKREHGFQGLTGDPSFLWDVDRRISHMDELGVDEQVITLALPPVWRGMDREPALELTRVANDAVVELAEEYPDRFIPVATLPYLDGEFLDEFDRCVQDLDVAGVQLFSHVEGRPLDEFEDVFARADRHDAPLWLHPQLHDWHDWVSEYMEHRLFGWPFDTTLALSRLVFSGVTERHDFDLVAHHLGGMIPFYAGRIADFYETREKYPENYADTDLPDFDTHPIEHFQDFYADTVISGHAPGLQCGHEFFGDDRLLYATDYPFGPERGRKWMQTGIETIDETLPEGAAEKAFSSNLERLIGRT